MNLKQLYNLFAQHPEGSWIMRWPNVQQLYRFVKKYDIKNVLDLGTGIGCSAAVVVLALKEKGVDYHIDSIEQYDKCVKIAEQLIPVEFKDRITIHKANVVVWQNEKMPYQNYSIYDKLLDGDYDLIINDGPGSFEDGGYYIDLPNGTIHKLLLEDKIKPGSFVIYDGRISSLKLLERYFSDNFYWIIMNDTRGNDFHALERRDNPVKFEDVMMKGMTNLNYFKEAK